MIRPFTCVCLLLAAGAGLYTYQAKHQSELLDREIERVLKVVDAARQRTGVLRAEYALLNDPSRLAQLTATHLPELRATEPTQYTNWAELDRRLPPVGPPPQAIPPVQERAVQEPQSLPETPLASAPPLPRADDGISLATRLAPRRILGGAGGGVVPVAATSVAPFATAPVDAALSQAAWAVPARPPLPVAAAPSRAEASRAEPSRAEASRAEPSRAEPSRAGPGRLVAVARLRKPAAPKVALAAARPRKTDMPAAPDSLVTPVSAPAEALAQYVQGSGVGRSGNGGFAGSALGMARTAAAPAQ